MTEREAFLAAIRAAPDDDLPRLVFADWLDEQGEGERAEFIRSQCADGSRESFNGSSLAMTHTQLAMRHDGYNWLGPWYDNGWGREAVWERGFVCELRTPFSEWIAYADRILPESVRLNLKLTDRPFSMAFNEDGRVQLRHTNSLWQGRWHESSLAMRSVEELIQLEWPELAKVELPPAVNWDTGPADIVGQLRDNRRQILHGSGWPYGSFTEEPESLTEVRRQLRLVRDAQRQYAYYQGATRFVRNETDTSITYIPDNEYMQMEAYARELENEIVRHTGRRDF